jgi:hypothetical protein
MLNLAEELFVLALDEDEGWIVESALDTLRYGLAAALLADLALRNRILVEDGRLHVRNTEPVGDELLDAALKRLTDADRPRRVKYWLSALSFRKLPKQVAERLVACGVLQRDDRRYVMVTPCAESPEPDAPAKYWIKQGLRSAVLTTAKAERHSIVLLSLMQGCRLLNLVFTKDERRTAGKRVKDLVQGEDFGEAVAQTLADIEAATTQAASNK